MGCVFGKDASPRRVERERSERNEGPVGEEVWAKVSNREVVDEVRNGCGNQRADDVGGAVRPRTERRRSSRPNPRLSNPPRNVHGEQVAASWPAWLSEVAGEAIRGWILQRADSFEKLDKINIVGCVVREFDSGTEESEIRQLGTGECQVHVPGDLDFATTRSSECCKLEVLVTSRMSCSLYLVFQYMEHDLAGLAASPNIKFTEPQVKCYVQQLLSGLEHCHNSNACIVISRDQIFLLIMMGFLR
ncbi:hypothetical protein MLD38_027875 [Melastoma candidum]|uniref:Uncharacterized protein n=1 Tax=Melastoma candidum TaxID=119954 RepID=A0ACB9MZF9_9MYRT|nr:hypothetical protein MLD38_027875 [Melastoma candidum]